MPVNIRSAPFASAVRVVERSAHTRLKCSATSSIALSGFCIVGITFPVKSEVGPISFPPVTTTLDIYALSFRRIGP
jgi:hypothetical protein